MYRFNYISKLALIGMVIGIILMLYSCSQGFVPNCGGAC